MCIKGTCKLLGEQNVGNWEIQEYPELLSVFYDPTDWGFLLSWPVETCAWLCPALVV